MSRQWLGLIAAALGVIVIAAWLLSGEGLAWWHLAGLGACVGLLALVWLWPGIRQPDKPPP